MMSKRTGLILALLLSVGACMPMPKKGPPPVVYQIKAPATGFMAQPPAVPAGTSLEVALPAVPAGYDKDRIALSLDNGRRLDYYSDARWAEHLPDVVQDVVIVSLRKSMAGLVVDDEDNLPAPTHRLRVDVLDFAPVYSAGADSVPKVRVSARFAVVDLRANAVMIDLTLGADVMPEANTLSAVTAALEMGLHRVLHDATPRLAGVLAPAKKPRR